MDLDKRIKKGKTYLDCFSLEKAKNFIGKECYIGEENSSFANLDDLTKAVLVDVTKHSNDTLPYTLSDKDSTYVASLILPCEWVDEKKEPKYRPFTGIEFAEKFDLKLGGIIRLKNIISQYQYKNIFTGYGWHGDDFEVCLNGGWIGLNTLLNTYEYEEDNEWKKFGVEE